MTIEEKATAYAENLFGSTVTLSGIAEKRAARNAYLAGATEALASMWVSVEERLPEEKRAVLCFMPNMKDPYAENESYFDMGVLLEGEFINLEADIIHPAYWMSIPKPPTKGGEK